MDIHIINNMNDSITMQIRVFPEMVVSPKHPKMRFLGGKPMVVGYHHFRKHLYKHLDSFLPLQPPLHKKLPITCTDPNQIPQTNDDTNVHCKTFTASWAQGDWMSGYLEDGNAMDCPGVKFV